MTPSLAPQSVESSHTAPEPSTRPVHVLDRLSDRYPPRLFAEHLMDIFGIHKSRFYELEPAGRFHRFELKPTIGRKAWSRALVQDYLDQVGAFTPKPHGVGR